VSQQARQAAGELLILLDDYDEALEAAVDGLRE